MHSALIDEWTPSGLSEESIVFGMADAEWRKASLAQICASQSDCQQFKPRHPAFDEARGLITLAQRMCREPETVFAEHASKYLRADKIGYLNQKFPRKNFESIKEWALAVLEEIKSALLPDTPGLAALDPATLDPATEAFCTEIIKMTEVFNTEIIKMHSFVTTIHVREFLDDDQQQERLDRRIARLLDELIEIKTRKQVLLRTSKDDKERRKISGKIGVVKANSSKRGSRAKSNFFLH